MGELSPIKLAMNNSQLTWISVVCGLQMIPFIDGIPRLGHSGQAFSSKFAIRKISLRF
jgi:hypothetical protein